MNSRLLLPLLVVISASITTLGQQQPPDAIVESVIGKAQVKASKDATEKGQLKPRDELFAGQWVSCASGCKQLIISYCNVPRPIGANPKWRQIFAINCKPSDGKRGGGRGEVGMLRFPIDSEVVRPKTFSIEWDRMATSSNVELSLRVIGGERIWGPYEVDGRKGSFTSDSLRGALERARLAGTLKLVLSATEGTKKTEKIELDVISAEQEADLEWKLDQFESEPDKIVKAMGRGTVFGQFDLITSEVAEFEKALSFATISKVGKGTLYGIKKLAIFANLKANNTERVRQLCHVRPSPTAEPMCMVEKKEH